MRSAAVRVLLGLARRLAALALSVAERSIEEPWTARASADLDAALHLVERLRT